MDGWPGLLWTTLVPPLLLLPLLLLEEAEGIAARFDGHCLWRE
jgi:hypothetical protein